MNGGAAEVQGYPGASALRVGAVLGGIVLAAVVIFGLGVMVGKRVAESVPVAAAPPFALPTETLPTQPAGASVAATPIPAEKMTFYDRLSGVAPAVPQALPALQPPQQALAPLAPPEVPARLPDARTPPAPPAKVAAPAARTATAARPAAPAKTDPAAQIRKLAGKGRFAVQMAAVSERSDAEATARRIKGQGFDVVTVMASIKGKIWYRIRVGSFPTRQAAAQAAGIFRSAYGLNAITVEN